MSDSQRWSQYEEVYEKPAQAPGSSDGTNGNTGNGESQNSDVKPLRERFSLAEIQHKVVFGGLVGSACGVTFGLIDGFKSLRQENKFLKGGDRTRMVMQRGVRTGGLFTGFFSLYQVTKYSVERARGKEDMLNPLCASAISLAPFYRTSLVKQNIAYTIMLIVMDTFHDEISEIFS